MLRKIGWVVGLSQKNWSAKKSPPLEQPGPASPSQQPRPGFDAVHEVAIYIHRFHNLDLFEQGWYRLKLTMKWEDGDVSYSGIPARVVQYEVPDVGGDNSCRVWMIDNTDNSFSTPPFRIRYSRQDVLLSIMVSFYISFGGYKGKSSAVILKFELMHSPYELGPELQNSLGSSAASVHEYRIPPKALLGLHSYCPVYFDSFHSVLIDTSVHISLLNPGNRMPQLKVPSDSQVSDGTHGEEHAGLNRAALIKAMMAAHDILLEDVKSISEGINQAIDLSGISLKPAVTKLFNSTSSEHMRSIDGEVSHRLSEKQKKIARNINRVAEESVQPSWNDLLYAFHSMGNQHLYLWHTFLKFHRENKTKVMEFLRKSWANDRRTEWSIWMIYSKVEMPHHYMSKCLEGTPLHHIIRGRSSSSRRLTDDAVQTAMMRAELHRRGIAQMRINNRSLQDMCIFEDILRVPIILVERLANINQSASINSYCSPSDEIAGHTMEDGSRTKNLSENSQHRKEIVLRVVIFVHGFQGHHLDLRLIRNQWLLLDPKIQFLMSEANEDKTYDDFREMGLRLANEVISFLKKKMDKASKSGHLKDIKLSFVGHSIGNLILRAALAETIMEPYHRFLYTYISISGPHLGYMYSSNSLFNSGLWFMKKIKGIPCIHQLTFTDDQDLENTFIYNLSKKKTLANFRNLILVSSPQDGYVPYHSARIEPCPAAAIDSSKQGKIFLEMLNNCLDEIRVHSEHRVVMRCDVNFQTSSHGKGLDTLIGRAAHIEFLECDTFIKFIMWSFPELFR